MHSALADPNLATAFEQIAAGIAAVRAAGLAPANAADGVVQVQELARLDAMLSAVQVDQVAALDKARVAGGHRYAHYLVRAEAVTTEREAVQRNQLRKAFEALPNLRAGHTAGDISRCQARALASVYANPRIRDAVVENESRLIDAARNRSVKEYDRFLRRFVDRVDEDGSHLDTERSHLTRKARWRENFEGGWDLTAETGRQAGAAMHEILEQYYSAETLVDWEKARADHGDDANRTHLARNNRQRYADALFQIFLDAVSRPPGSNEPRFTINLVMDKTTFDREVARLGGQPVPADDPLRADYQCRTLDGIDINPREVVASLVAGQLEFSIRRAVIDAKSVVIDLGQQRTFTGRARLAAMLPRTHCLWPGCHTKVSHCDIDHLDEFSAGGQTTQANAAPLCGWHNRYKHGLCKDGRYRVQRTPLGELQLLDRDGNPVRIQ